MRIGIGYDTHVLTEGRPMVIGGVDIPFPKGPVSHSDGDALLHAICDAILGALAKEDIGTLFPDTDPEYKDVPSRQFLISVKDLMDSEGYAVGNLDCIVIAEEPKIGPYRDKIAKVISDILKMPAGAVSVKAKTAEGLGAVGEGRAIAAYAAVILEEK